MRHLNTMFWRFMAAVVLAGSAAGCSSHRYETEARSYTDAVLDELVKTGRCADVAACRAEELVLWEAGGWSVGPWQGGGVVLHLYKVSDARVVDAVVERCRRLHQANQAVDLQVTIAATAHIDQQHPGTERVVKTVRFRAST